MVKVEGDARQVAEILQQREQRKENRHRRQHDRNHPGERLVRAVDQQADQPVGQDECGAEAAQHLAERKQSLGEQRGGVIGARNRQPEDDEQHQQHDREAGQLPRQDAVEPLVTAAVLFLHAPHRDRGDALGVPHDGRNDLVAERSAVEALERRVDRFLLSERDAEVRAQRGADRIVAVDQTQRKPARRDLRRAVRPQDRHELCDRRFHRIGIDDAVRLRRFRLNHLREQRHQVVQPAPAARARPDDRHAEQQVQLFEVDGDAAALRLVHQVDADDRARLQLDRLQNEVQVALEARRIAHDDRSVRAAEAQEIPRRFLLGGVGHQRVAARQVDEHIAVPAERAVALRIRDRLPRPVPGRLLYIWLKQINGY